MLFGIAIISIMIFHWCENYVAVYDSGLLWMMAEVYVLLIGSIGVEIFLFLSGIGLCYSLKKDNSVKSFYKRRLLRILPAYAIGGGIYWIVEDIIILKGSFINVVYDFSFASFWCDSVTRFWYIELLLPLYILYLLVYKCFDTEKKMAFRRLMIIISGSVLLITIVWFFGKDTYENIEIALWRIPIFLAGAYMGEPLYAGDESNRGDGIVYVIGIALKFMACVCIFGMMVGKYTLPNILRSRLAVSVFAVALICVVVMLLEKMKCDKLNRFFSYAGIHWNCIFHTLRSVPLQDCLNFLYITFSFIAAVWRHLLS